MAPRDPVRIGLIGAGFLAATRVRCYRKVAGARAEIVAVASADPVRAAAFAARHGIPAALPDAAALLARAEVDLVDLCVPNALHRPLAEAAAAAGKHIVCTKPLAIGAGGSSATAAARAMLAAAERAGVKLMYGENWVYAPAVAKARELAAAAGGVLLEMRGWEAHSGSHAAYAADAAAAGGGALLRLGVHPIGAMLLLKHEEGLRLRARPTRAIAVTAETAELGRPGANGVETWGCATIAFDDGTRGLAWGSDVQLGGMESRLELLGSNFRVSCRLSPAGLVEAYAPNEDVFHGVELQEKLATRAGWSTPTPDADWTSGHQAMCEAFVRDVAEDRPPLAGGRLGLAAVEVLEAAYRSAAEGRRVAL